MSKALYVCYIDLQNLTRILLAQAVSTMQGSPIQWNNLIAGAEYYVATTGFLGSNTPEKIRIIEIMTLPQGEAMIFADAGRGYAVGGIFEGDKLGPKNRFWTTVTNNITQ